MKIYLYSTNDDTLHTMLRLLDKSVREGYNLEGAHIDEVHKHSYRVTVPSNVGILHSWNHRLYRVYGWNIDDEFTFYEVESYT